MERSYYVVDVFTADPFGGNPAAVVLDAKGLDDAAMQSIASEFNLSETTFILPPGDVANSIVGRENGRGDLHVRFRWFTPAMEVKMCGHATIAGVHALVESGRLHPPEKSESVRVRIETLSGPLAAYVERIPESDTDRMIWLDLIDPVLTEHRLDAAELCKVLRLSPDAFDPSLPIVKTQDDDVLVFVRDFQALNEARPAFPALAELLHGDGLRGMSLATVKTITSSVTLQSRFFAPAAGIDEDPVTGSVHGPLAVYLVERGLVPLHDGIAALACIQGKPDGRTGLLHALVQPKDDGPCSVRIGGRAVTTMRGTLAV